MGLSPELAQVKGVREMNGQDSARLDWEVQVKAGSRVKTGGHPHATPGLG